MRGYATEMDYALSEVFGVPARRYATQGRADEIKVWSIVSPLSLGTTYSTSGAERRRQSVFPTSSGTSASRCAEHSSGGFCLATGPWGLERSHLGPRRATSQAAGFSLLGSLGIIAGSSRIEPGTQTGQLNGRPIIQRHPHWTITVSSRDDLRALEGVWLDHPRGRELQATLLSRRPGRRRLTTPAWRPRRFASKVC